MANLRDASDRPDASDERARALRARMGGGIGGASPNDIVPAGVAPFALGDADPRPKTLSRSRGFASVLRNRYFLRLWMAQLVSQTILNAANYALIILIQTQLHSFTATSGAIVAFSLPALFFSAPAGVLVDHLNRRTVLWVSNMLRAIACGLFVLSLFANSAALVPAYVLAFLLASISQFFTPAEGASIPLLVHSDELINALALFNVTFTLAQVLGLIIFGPLVLLLVPTFDISLGHQVVFHETSVESLFVLLALLYLVCAALILSIPARRMKPRRPTGRPTGALPSIRHDGRQVRNIWLGIVESWNYIRKDRHLLVAVFQLAFAGSIVAVVAIIAPRIVTEFLNQRAALAALVFIPAGVGLVLGSAFVPRIVRRIGYRWTVFVGVAALAISAACLPLVRAVTAALFPAALHILPGHVSPDPASQGRWPAWPYVAIILLLTFIIGVALDFINIPAQTILQARSQDWIKGRVLAVQALLLNAVTIPFVLIIGRIADLTGLMATIAILAIIIAVFGVGSLSLSVLGDRRVLERWTARRRRLGGRRPPSGPPLVASQNESRNTSHGGRRKR